MVQPKEPAPDAYDLWPQFLDPVRDFGKRVARFPSQNAKVAATGEACEIAVWLTGTPEDGIHLAIRGDRPAVTGENRARHG